MTTTAAPSRTRSRRMVALVCGLVIAVVVMVALVLRQRSQARLPEALRARAGAVGVVLKFSTVRVTPWETKLGAVEIAFARAPGVKASADAATLRAGSGDLPEIVVQHLTVNVAVGALVAVEELAQLELWRDLPLTWRRLTVRYENRLVGDVVLDEVRLERAAAPSAAAPSVSPGAPLVLTAGSVRLGARRWGNVVLSLQRRGQMVEIGIGGATVASAPVVLGAFPPQGPVTTFIGTVAHPPAATLAGALGIRLGAAFEGARVGGSFSFTIPEQTSRPVTGNLELIASGWPAPATADAAVVLGRTLGFGTRLVPAVDGTAVALEGARLSTSLFSLFGSGRLLLQPDLRLTLDLSGSLTCAQIRGNLPPSDLLTTVSRYLAATPSRSTERATMRIQLDAALAKTEDARLSWTLDAACGLAGFTVGAAL